MERSYLDCLPPQALEIVVLYAHYEVLRNAISRLPSGCDLVYCKKRNVYFIVKKERTQDGDDDEIEAMTDLSCHAKIW